MKNACSSCHLNGNCRFRSRPEWIVRPQPPKRNHLAACKRRGLGSTDAKGWFCRLTRPIRRSQGDCSGVAIFRRKATPGKQTKSFQLSFNGLLKVDFQGSLVTSDGGLILVRELDERLGLGKLIDEYLSDSRQGLNKRFSKFRERVLVSWKKCRSTKLVSTP